MRGVLYVSAKNVRIRNWEECPIYGRRRIGSWEKDLNRESKREMNIPEKGLVNNGRGMSV